MVITPNTCGDNFNIKDKEDGHNNLQSYEWVSRKKIGSESPQNNQTPSGFGVRNDEDLMILINLNQNFMTLPLHPITLTLPLHPITLKMSLDSMV
jgi:hypothetical protein